MSHTTVRSSEIVSVAVDLLDLPLYEPFTIATGRMEAARNVLVRVRLADGSEGLGEAAPMPASGGETQGTALAAAREMSSLLSGHDATSWRTIARDLEASFEHQATARAAVEVALLDALARSWDIPLYRFFGGAQDRLQTDITVPIVEVERVAELARTYAQRGAKTLKLKVGVNVAEDADRVFAAIDGAPEVRLILDGNQGYTPIEALELIETLAHEGVRPVLFEQPVHRHDLEGMRFVAERAGVPVAADESVHTAADALRVARMGAAQVVNIKLMKSGLVEALDIAAVCRAAHLDLMVGAMMESRLGIAASAHLVAGLGGFRYVDLDTPMLIAEDPFEGGYTQDGMTYLLDPHAAGHGVTLRG